MSIEQIAYRKTFAAVWDFRFNHIVTPRTSGSFSLVPLSFSLLTERPYI
jgi:diacylglycerol diphosphate phosphatase/phosphatidate phosphatase